MPGYMFDESSSKRIADVVRIVEGDPNAIRYRRRKRYVSGAGISKAFSVTLNPASPDADPPVLASINIEAGRVQVDGTDLFWDMGRIEDEVISGPTDFAFPTIVKDSDSAGDPYLEIFSSEPEPTSSMLYRPLVRLKSEDSGASWSFDSPGHILYDGNINFSGLIIFGQGT